MLSNQFSHRIDTYADTMIVSEALHHKLTNAYPFISSAASLYGDGV